MEAATDGLEGIRVYPTAAIRELIEQTFADEELSVETRDRELTLLGEQLRELAARTDHYRGTLGKIEEGTRIDHAALRREARETADIRRELLRREMATEEQLDKLGILSHEQLNQAEAEGTLEEAIGSSLQAFGLGLLSGPMFERMIRRSRRTGQFQDKPGTALPIMRGVPEVDVPTVRGPRAAPKRTRIRRQFDPSRRTRVGSAPKRVRSAPSRKRSTRTKAYETNEVTPKQLADHANLPDAERRKARHPALTKAAYDQLRERRTGKSRGVGPTVSREEVEAQLDLYDRGEHPMQDRIERYDIARNLDFTSEAFRERGYESRKEKLSKRIDKLLALGVRENSDAEMEFNAAGKVSQNTLLQFVRDALTGPDTVDLHSTEDANGKTVWDEDRKELHASIIDLLLRQRDADGNLCADCDHIPAAEGAPTVLFTGGGYSAGKGSVLGQMDDVPENAIVIDPDQIKALLPEFDTILEGDPEANLMVYRESWAIAQELQAEAMEPLEREDGTVGRPNIIVDGITNTSEDEVIDRVKGFVEAGYKDPKIVYVDIPTDEANKRAGIRAKKAKKPSDRRFIPESILRAVHRDVAATVPQVAERAAEIGLTVEVWDNDQGQDEEGNFIPPKRFFQQTPDAKEIEDEELFNRFLAKGHEDIPQLEDAPTARLKLADVLQERLETPKDEEGKPLRGEASDRILGTFYDTRDKWSVVRADGKRVWDAERKKLHDEIVESWFQDEDGNPIPPTPEGIRQALFMAGIPASGKSTALADEHGLLGDDQDPLGELSEEGHARRDELMARDDLSPDELEELRDLHFQLNSPANAIEINTDAVRERLPEFGIIAAAGDHNASNGTHEEAKEISRRIEARAVEEGYNIVVDGVGNKSPGEFAERLRQAKATHRVTVLVTDIDREEAKARSRKRYLEGPKERRRWTSPDVIDYYDDRVAARHLEWRDDPEIGWVAVNTDVPRGEPPITMARKLHNVARDGMELLDELRYGFMVRKAEAAREERREWARERAEET